LNEELTKIWQWQYGALDDVCLPDSWSCPSKLGFLQHNVSSILVKCCVQLYLILLMLM